MDEQHADRIGREVRNIANARVAKARVGREARAIVNRELEGGAHKTVVDNLWRWRRTDPLSGSSVLPRRHAGRVPCAHRFGPVIHSRSGTVSTSESLTSTVTTVTATLTIFVRKGNSGY